MPPKQSPLKKTLFFLHAERELRRMSSKENIADKNLSKIRKVNLFVPRRFLPSLFSYEEAQHIVLLSLYAHLSTLSSQHI